MKKYLFILKNCPFFSGMSEEEILSILNCIDAKVLCKEANEYILRAGDSTTSMGLVLKGSVLVVQEDLWGHRNIMSKIEEGDFFLPPFLAVLAAKVLGTVFFEGIKQDFLLYVH